MIDLKKSLGIAVAALALMGAGCAGQAPSSATPTSKVPEKVPAPVAEAPKGPVKFSEVKSDLFGLEGKYSSLTFTGAAGTCVTVLPYTNLSYSPSQPGYNYMLRDNGNKIDDSSSSNTQSVLFEGKTTAGAKVDCKMMIPYGSDTATLTCADAAEKEVCSATYTVMANPV